MSLNTLNDEQKPCVKPYQLTLDDCLACSSCITSSEESILTRTIDIKLLKEKSYFIISPHVKINIFDNMPSKVIINSKLSQLENFRLFEDLLASFLKNKFDSRLIDTSHTYPYLYEESLKNLKNKNLLITSSCPGTVIYIERKGQHLIDNLLKIKSPQQITAETCKKDKKIVSIVTCYDKKLEKTPKFDHVITTKEFHYFLIQNRFLEYFPREKLKYTSLNTITILRHRSMQINENYIEYFLQNIPFKHKEEKMINKNLYEYVVTTEERVYKFARIFGLENVINFVNKSRKKIEYDFVEAFICNFSCINGPSQFKNTLDRDIEFLKNIENLDIKINSELEKDVEIKREFEILKKAKKKFNVEW